MILRVEIDGRIRAVEVRREAAAYVVTIDGRAHTVDVSDLGGLWSLLVGTRSHEVAFLREPDGSTVVQVDGRTIRVAVEAAGRSWSARRGGQSATMTASTGPHRIVAPMPGRIVKVLVKPGDAVEPRQGLVVVEAMKMENELRSRHAGTVSEVRAIEGASVEAGALLVIVE